MISSRLFSTRPWSVLDIRCIFLLFVCVSHATSAFAATAASSKEKTHDIRVLVDVSGSMKKSDPNNLRIPATELLLNLFPNGSRAGVWVFGQRVDRLVPLATVDDAWKKKALRNAKKINSSSMRTNIGEALLKASVGWEKPDPGTIRSIILLTDGRVDVSPDAVVNQGARERVLNSILPQLRARQISINTIALSADADSQLMEQLALATEGKFNTINSADELLKTFVNTFDKVVPLDQVPIKGNQFAIDKSVNEFTALIFTQEGAAATALQTPSGKKFDKDQHDASVQWFHAPTYDLITVSKPEAGQWHLLGGSDESNRVTVVSDLKLQVDPIPVNILSGERVAITISLLENDKLLDKQAFLDLLSIQVRQQQLGGQQWSAPLGGTSHKGMSEPGRFLARFGKTLVPGEHEFTIQVDGKTFQRQNVQKIRVLDNPLILTWAAAADKHSYMFTVSDEKQILDPEKTSVLLRLTDAEAHGQELKLDVAGKHQWQGQVQGISTQKQYSYVLKIAGFSASNRALDYETLSQPLVLDASVKPAAPVKENGKEPSEKSAENTHAQGMFSQLSTSMLMAWLLGINLLLFLLGFGIYLLVRKLRNKKQTDDDSETENNPSASVAKAATAGVALAASTAAPEKPAEVAATPAEAEIKSNKRPDEIPDEEVESNLHDVDAIESQTDETDLKNIQLDDSILENETENKRNEPAVEPAKENNGQAAAAQAQEKQSAAPLAEAKKPHADDEIDLDEDFDLDIDELLEK